MQPSSIPGAGLDVFTIVRQVTFGPYEGERVQASDVIEDTDTSCMWEVRYTCMFSCLLPKVDVVSRCHNVMMTRGKQTYNFVLRADVLD